MKQSKHWLIAIATIVTSLGTPILAQASLVTTDSYYIRPGLRVDLGQFIDGYQANGSISDTMSQGALGYSESTVNLNDGTVKMYIEYFGGGPSGNLQTFGGFGERITITGGANTYWDLGFAIDGFMDVNGGEPIINGSTPPAFFYDVGLAVYRPGEATYTNFVPNFNSNSPVFYQQNPVIEEIDTTQETSFFDIFSQVSTSIFLESDYEVFDIFTFTNMVVNSEFGDGLESFIADLTNTARYEQVFEPGVSAFSSSGQFLNLATPPPAPPSTTVPTPPSLILIMLGVVGILVRDKMLRAD